VGSLLTLQDQDDSYDCVAKNSNTVCTLIVTYVTLTHIPGLEPETIRYELLKQKDQIISDLGKNDYDVRYVGDETLEAQIVVTLRGVPEEEMGDSEAKYFQDKLRNFLNNTMSSSGIQILSVRVDGQYVYKENKRTLQREEILHRRIQDSSVATVDVLTTVKGIHRPPPDVDFDELVEDSIDRESDKFQDELKSGCEEYFHDVDHIGSSSVMNNAHTRGKLDSNEGFLDEDGLDPQGGLQSGGGFLSQGSTKSEGGYETEGSQIEGKPQTEGLATDELNYGEDVSSEPENRSGIPDLPTSTTLPSSIGAIAAISEQQQSFSAGRRTWLHFYVLLFQGILYFFLG